MPKVTKPKGFSAEESAAMRERYEELQADRADGAKLVMAKIAKMPVADRVMAKKIHALVMKNAPDLTPRTWYGMPAYSKNDKVVCFFTAASKFKARYSTLGFNDSAKLDSGDMWPVSFALKKIGRTEEAKISALIKKAVK